MLFFLFLISGVLTIILQCAWKTEKILFCLTRADALTVLFGKLRHSCWKVATLIGLIKLTEHRDHRGVLRESISIPMKESHATDLTDSLAGQIGVNQLRLGEPKLCMLINWRYRTGVETKHKEEKQDETVYSLWLIHPGVNIYFHRGNTPKL